METITFVYEEDLTEETQDALNALIERAVDHLCGEALRSGFLAADAAPARWTIRRSPDTGVARLRVVWRFSRDHVDGLTEEDED
jgi:hypothetical protein